MDQFDTDIFQFRHVKEEMPPSDYVIKQIESLAELGLSEEEAFHLSLITLGYNHFVWN